MKVRDATSGFRIVWSIMMVDDAKTLHRTRQNWMEVVTMSWMGLIVTRYHVCVITALVVLKSTLNYFDPNRKGRNDSRCH